MEDHQPHTGLLGCRDWQHSIHIICRHLIFEFSLQYCLEIHMKGDETDDAQHDLLDSAGVEISGLGVSPRVILAALKHCCLMSDP